MWLFYLLLSGVFTLFLYILLSAFFAHRKRASYLAKNGIPNLGATFGKTLQLMTGSLNYIHYTQQIYEKAVHKNAKIVGHIDNVGVFTLILTDLDLIKSITVKDFDHFVNLRDFPIKVSSKYVSRMMMLMRYDEWKETRAKLTPAFTTGKIRRMYQIFYNSSRRFDNSVKNQMNFPNNKSVELDVSKLMVKYSVDVVANCLFGVDTNCWNLALDQESTFEKYAKQLQFKASLSILFKFAVIVFAPRIASALNLEVFDKESQTYFATVIKDVAKRRRQTGERRPDFLQLLMDVQDGTLKPEVDVQEVYSFSEEQRSKASFTDDDIVANALMFFFAGFETTQTILQFALYSLAAEQDVQEKLRQEVNAVKGELTYEAIMEMTYLDWVINETLRMYPTTAKTERQCNKDYPVPGTDFVIKKDTMVVISQRGIHMDARYWPNPTKFYPERFSAEGKANRPSFAFMPFGNGPRHCIGMRFALIKIKTLIALLVLHYYLEPCPKTVIPPEFAKESHITAKPKHAIWLKFVKREN